MSVIDRWPKWPSTTIVYCPRQDIDTIHGHPGWIACMNKGVQHQRLAGEKDRT